MEEEEGGLRLSKRFSDNGGGEVDYKTKSGTAWSHSYLNQKPWHPLSYPNQRRKWIAEQTHSQRQSRSEEVAREYAQEQEFFRQTAMLSKKEKEKVDMMQAVSFMYVRPPGYNAESAKAAEIVGERKNAEQNDPTRVASSSMPQEAAPVKEEKKKPRPKDVFGRSLPTEEQFEVLKNAPRLETGVAGRAKPFAVEVRNVKCVRCGNYGHQSGDRECPLKDAIMPNEESRLKRDDPLTAILAHTTDPSEPLKWELKQKPGISPPRGGFKPDDPNQQIVAEEIFDEYGGFLSGGNIPELLTNFSSAKHGKKFKTKGKHKKHSSSGLGEENEDGGWDSRRKEKTSKQRKKTSKDLSGSSSSDDSRLERRHRSSRQTRRRSSRREDDSSDTERRPRRKENIHREREQPRSWSKHKRTHSPKSSESGDHHERRRHRRHRHHHRRDSDTNSSLE